MSNISKAGVMLASAVGVAFALTGCASQQSGAATPQNLPNNCAAYAQPAPSCKGYNKCKAVHRYKKNAAYNNANTQAADGTVAQ